MGLMEGAAERLAAERRRALQRLAGLTRDYESVVSASRDTNADDEHDPEGMKPTARHASQWTRPL